MSRANKVNRDNYTQAGRLTPDDMARERKKMVVNGGNLRESENVKQSERRRSVKEPGAQAPNRARSAPEE